MGCVQWTSACQQGNCTLSLDIVGMSKNDLEKMLQEHLTASGASTQCKHISCIQCMRWLALQCSSLDGNGFDDDALEGLGFSDQPSDDDGSDDDGGDDDNNHSGDDGDDGCW
jgi:hypothetical protein